MTYTLTSVSLAPLPPTTVCDEDGGTEEIWPWLRLEIDARPLAGRWIRMTYRSGLLDPLVRPVLRCVGTPVTVDRMLPAALFGNAIWLGLIPRGTQQLHLSPSNHAGSVAFAIDSIERLSDLELGWSLFRRSPRRWFYWRFAPLVGLRRASDVQIRRQLSPTPLDEYDAWRRRRSRPFDWAGFDRPVAGASACHIRYVCRAGPGTEAAVDELAVFLRRQPYRHWSVILLEPHGIGTPPTGSMGPFESMAAEVPLASLTVGLADSDLIVPFDLADSMPDYAPAAFAQAAQDQPSSLGFYADADEVDGQGRLCQPALASDDGLTAGANGRGTAFAVRVEAVHTLSPTLTAEAFTTLTTSAVSQNLARSGQRMYHVRRVLLTRPVTRHRPAAVPVSPSRPIATPGRPAATIIIPTKDRLDLLGRCVASLKQSLGSRDADIIVVDNGSLRADTKSFLAALVSDHRFTVLEDPGPFNFSRLCNAAASLARTASLVFLNNDTEAIDSRWLDEMLHWAGQPDVGAVGGKLLYPDLTVQHAGVIIGIDGLAGHFERGCGRQESGFFGRLLVPHGVSAVSAACLAVEKRKFDAVGGFDETNLPVDLNDIDLCLRLARRGWRCMLAPDAVLIHHESASRGVTSRPDVRYRTEQAAFRARWAQVIRDDPHFHPALSLDSLSPRLG